MSDLLASTPGVDVKFALVMLALVTALVPSSSSGGPGGRVRLERDETMVWRPPAAGRPEALKRFFILHITH